ncbi:SHUGOSHIN 2-like isoform X2 [Mercurialis annua]|uniref:SHUGOSHIN 2-like isoform X2 n=1 Tax=Mercurialis annua TaxID=3986 RepID=UPI0021602A1B|nr:SHUGOSHIN 2-like isoform X2 [Mercurialis annua]
MKGEKMAKRSSFGSLVRKRLSDITNSQQQTPKIVSIEENQQQQEPPISNPTDELINQLLKERMTLMKLVEERDKIIALSNNQMRSLRMQYQKLQMQNWNLAQSNSHIIAEINFGREKVKTLQHELVCKDALLKAKNLELEEKTNILGQNTGSEEVEKNDVGECLNKACNDMKPDARCSRRRIPRSRSMGSSTASRQCAEKQKLENKRLCVRRQSTSAIRFKSQDEESSENLFEIDNVEFPITHQQLQEDDPTLSSSSIINEEDETCHTSNGAKLAQKQRHSIGRPIRKAAEKVQSYKEVPLNSKMRRNL